MKCAAWSLTLYEIQNAPSSESLKLERCCNISVVIELFESNFDVLLQLMSSYLDSKLREDLERMKKIRAHRGMRHYWGLRVRGQHTKTTGRRGRTVGVSKKK